MGAITVGTENSVDIELHYQTSRACHGPEGSPNESCGNGQADWAPASPRAR